MVNKTVKIAVNAADDTAVARVELWIDGSLFAADTTARVHIYLEFSKGRKRFSHTSGLRVRCGAKSRRIFDCNAH